MRITGWIIGAVLLGINGFSQEGWQRRAVAADTNAWQDVRTAVAAGEGRLIVRNEGDMNGFVLPRSTPPRRDVSVEADVTVRQRLGKSGWNFAGVTLYQDDSNYWMLALVEGPEGSHSVDFIECHAGVWQAQNEGATALKREGNPSFAWKAGSAYRLRLAFRDGKVCAEVADSADGAVLASSFFTFGSVAAVRCGRPGLIVHASVAECAGFNVGKRGPSSGGRGLPEVALLDDDLPGHDRAANARLAEALSQKGFNVSRLSAEQLIAPVEVTAERFPILVLPQCASLPAQAAALVTQFAREGGHVIFLGGPFLDDALWRVGGKWLDAAGRTALLSRVEPAHRPFVIGPKLDLATWRRSCSDKAAKTEFRVVSEGPENKPCLRLDIANLQGWDVRHSPEIPALFGAGDDFFTFLAKGSEKTSQIAVEIIEKDGSRWIATAELTSEWRRVGLTREAFLFWPDASAKRRGAAGGRMDPAEVVRVGFGMSTSHTPAMVGSAHTVWLADVGTARDPLVAAGLAGAAEGGNIETVYPRYKVHAMPGPVEVHVAENGSRGRLPALACKDVVCAIPRTLGEGLGRDGRWRFIPMADAAPKAGKTSGVCEWLLLNNRMPLEGSVFAGFGYTDAAVWSSPNVLERIADAAALLRSGGVFEEAGTEQFAYWPGEPVRLGARVRAFGEKKPEVEITLEVMDGARVVWRESVKRSLELGITSCAFVWQPPAAPGVYTFRARLEGAGIGRADAIQHNFTVLDPAPAPKSAFITARGGDFWLEGKKWYPVGMNYWPLYVSGMDRADYWPGWLRDAYYSPALVERDLKQMVDMGINMVSIQNPPPAEYRNVLDFIRLCKKHGLYVNLYVGQASPLAFNDAELKSFLETSRIPGNATVFAYDTIWEPGNHVFKDDAARAKWDNDWRAWIDERYGSVENAEKDWGFKARRDKDGKVISPPDVDFREDGAWRGMMAAYRRFMDNLTSRLWGQSNRRLRELDPNHLVSFRQGNTLPHDFALSGPVKHIDFICPEGYAIRDTDEGEDAIGFITRYVDFTTGGKPIVWSEFGQSVWDGVRQAPNPVAVQKQGAYSERFYRTALAAGANGTVPWWWVGGYREDERSDFGILDPDRTERPAAQLIRDYGPRLKASRAKPQPTAWFEFDRDAHAGGYCRAAFHEGAAAYRAAVKDGNMLGVRTAGTGMDSATVPLVAVGNVPCSGSNPPKYLDAEFNFLQVLDADGVWQEAKDSSVITVKVGLPVRARASLGNVQEAAWAPSAKAGDVVGSVALVARVSGSETGRWPVTERVPYLGDAAIGEFTLLPQVGPPVTLSLRLEALGRTAFGEVRVFTLKAKGP
jgi:hypothetical protein